MNLSETKIAIIGLGYVGLPLSVAFAEKYKGTDNLCVTMFGDGAARQGALHESFNMAMSWKLPVPRSFMRNSKLMPTPMVLAVWYPWPRPAPVVPPPWLYKKRSKCMAE